MRKSGLKFLPMAAALCGLVALALVTDSSVDAAKKNERKGIITRPSFDPAAERVELMDAVDAGQLSAKMIPRNAQGGNVLIENLTDEPLTVQLPDSVVAVSVHAQFGGGAGGLGGGGAGGFGGGGLGGGGGGGQQAAGGGFGGGGGGIGGGGIGGGGIGGMGGGGGFFSIPPQSIVSVPLNTVCLEHGKPEPSQKSDYKLIRVEQFSDNPLLPELLAMVGTGRVDKQAAQAAAWHLTDKMSWEQLAAKTQYRVGGAGHTPYFHPNQLLGAQQLIAASQTRAAERGNAEPEQPKIPSRVSTAR